MQEKKVILPEELTNEEITHTLFPENNYDLGILFTTSNEAAFDDVILHMYLLQADSEETYHVVNELEKYQFNELQEAKDFAQQLSQMSALDYVMLINGTNRELQILH